MSSWTTGITSRRKKYLLFFNSIYTANYNISPAQFFITCELKESKISDSQNYLSENLNLQMHMKSAGIPRNFPDSLYKSFIAFQVKNTYLLCDLTVSSFNLWPLVAFVPLSNKLNDFPL